MKKKNERTRAVPNCSFPIAKKESAIFLSLQRTEIKLSKGEYKEEDLKKGPKLNYKIRWVGLYLMIESDIGLAVIWDRKTHVRILLEPEHRVSHTHST